jgi:hypothetical protein
VRLIWSTVAQVYLARHRIGRLLQQEIKKLSAEEP